MTPFTRYITLSLIMIFISVPAFSGDYFLYTPQPASSDQKKTPEDGILVQEIEVQKGDTLFDLSRKFSGHGMYYPQILLFNAIKNPNLIYTGHTLKVPLDNKRLQVSVKSETKSTPRTKGKIRNKGMSRAKADKKIRKPAATLSPETTNIELSLHDLKALGGTEKQPHHIKKKRTPYLKKSVPLVIPLVEEPSSTTVKKTDPVPSDLSKEAGEQLFEAAVKAYRKDDFSSAVQLFDRFLAENSASPLAADASLYKAECYLKLSSQ